MDRPAYGPAETTRVIDPPRSSLAIGPGDWEITVPLGRELCSSLIAPTRSPPLWEGRRTMARPRPKSRVDLLVDSLTSLREAITALN